MAARCAAPARVPLAGARAGKGPSKKEAPMAIAGFLVQTLPEQTRSVEAALTKMPGVRSYGIHEGAYIVAVAESETARLEALVERMQELEGVLAVYLTSVTTEDEEEPGDR